MVVQKLLSALRTAASNDSSLTIYPSVDYPNLAIELQELIAEAEAFNILKKTCRSIERNWKVVDVMREEGA